MQIKLTKSEFNVLYHALIIQGSTTQHKGLVVLRNELELLNSLENISYATDVKITDDVYNREMTCDEDIIDMSNACLDLIISYISNTPWKIGPWSKNAVLVVSRLSNAKSNI